MEGAVVLKCGCLFRLICRSRRMTCQYTWKWWCQSTQNSSSNPPLLGMEVSLVYSRSSSRNLSAVLLQNIFSLRFNSCYRNLFFSSVRSKLSRHRRTRGWHHQQHLFHWSGWRTFSAWRFCNSHQHRTHGSFNVETIRSRGKHAYPFILQIFWQAEISKYKKAIQWLRDILYNVHWEADRYPRWRADMRMTSQTCSLYSVSCKCFCRLKSVCKKMANSIGSYKKDGETVAYCAMNDLLYHEGKQQQNNNHSSHNIRHTFTHDPSACCVRR